MHKVVASNGFVFLLRGAEVRPYGRLVKGRSTHVVQTLSQPRLDVSEDLLKGALGRGIVLVIQRRRIDQCQSEREFFIHLVGRQVNVDRHGPDMRSMTTAALDELGHGRELVVGDEGGHCAGV